MLARHNGQIINLPRYGILSPLHQQPRNHSQFCLPLLQNYAGFSLHYVDQLQAIFEGFVTAVKSHLLNSQGLGKVFENEALDVKY